MKKRIFSIMLTLCMLLTLLPVAATAADNGKAIRLGVSGIADPTAITTASGTHYAPNSYVYFGVNGDASEPIEWRVLDADKANDANTSGMFLLSEYLLATDVTFYPKEKGDVNVYQGSDAQKWNIDFASSTSNFMSNEQSAMLGLAKTDASESDLYGQEWGESSLTANDKTFFLSVRELANYMGNYQYAPGFVTTDVSGAADAWWLRTPSAGSNLRVCVVDDKGEISNGSVRSDFGARPAFNLNLNSVLFTSAAEGGKSSGDAGALKEIAPYTGSEWKLTLKDGSRAFEASASKTAVNKGETIAITYSGAQTGDNEYVSAMIVDDNGEALYYGRLVNNSASGTANLVIPAELALGSYTLKVFSEQVNGDKRTDYASDFVNIPLTVAQIYDVTVETDGSGMASASPASATQGTTINLTATPNTGYHFKEWQVTSGGASIANNQFAMPAENVTVKAVFEKNFVYTIIKGAGQSVTQGEEASFTSDAAFNKFLRVLVDGEVVDPANYTAVEASTKVTLNGAFVAKLTPGVHTLTIVSTDGSATTTFIVEAPIVPQTGDSSTPMLWLMLMCVSGAAVVVMMKKRICV